MYVFRERKYITYENNIEDTVMITQLKNVLCTKYVVLILKECIFVCSRERYQI